MANLSNINNKFLVTTGGTVLIGQTAVVGPSKLQVEGSTNAIIRMNSTAGTGGRMDFVHSGSNYGNIGSARNLLGTGNASDMMVNAGSLLILGVGSQDMTILPSGNVGIGTPTPDAKLHIYGSTSLSEMYLGEDAAADKAGILKYTQGDGSGTGFITLSHWGNTSVTESLAIKYGGNVGIGTTTPSSKLHVVSDEVVLGSVITDYRDLAIQVETTQETANSGTGISFDHGALGAAIASARVNNSTWGTDLRFYTHPDATTNQRNVTERMRINSDGNVGIAAIPGAVNSSIRVLRIGQRGVFSAYTNSGNVYMSNNVRVISNGNNTAIVTGESAQYRQDGGTHIWYNAASVSAGAVSALTERMRIESTGVIKFSNTATSTGDVGTIAHYTNNYMYIRGGTGGLAIGDDGFDTNIYLNNNDSIQFSTSGSEKMRISSTGLTIFKSSFIAAGLYGGELNIGGSSVTTFGLQAKYNQGGATQSTLYSSPGYTSNDQLFLLGAGAGNTAQLVLKGDGNVGIGLTTPTGNLSMNSQIDLGANPPSTYITNTAATRYQSFFKSGFAYNTDGLGPYPRYFDMVATGSPDSTNGGSNLRFFTTGIAPDTGAELRMSITSRGRVGIGDSNPAYRLSVTGSLDERVQINSTANKTAGIYMRVLSSGTVVGTGTVATQNDGSMKFFTGTSSEAVAMTLDTDGRLQDTSGIYLGSNNNVNLLNYYASDTWTPIVITSQGTSPGINSASGRWQRVGKVVTASFEFTMNNPAVGAGIVVINNLPVAIADTDHVSGCGVIKALGKTINVFHNSGTNQIGMYFYDGNYCGTQYRTVGTVTYWAAT